MPDFCRALMGQMPKADAQKHYLLKIEPQKEHEWLQQLVGEWTYESECSMEPGKPPEKFEGSESVRSLDSLWDYARVVARCPV